MAIFNADTPAKRAAVTRYLSTHIKAPYVDVMVATLGGVEHASAIVRTSLDPKWKWYNGILNNSRVAFFHISRGGLVENFHLSPRVSKRRMARFRATSLPQAVAKINAFLDRHR